MRALDDSLDDLSRATTKALARAFASGEVSPVEATKASLDRAEAINGRLNAFALIDREGALAAAAQAERRWKGGAAVSPIDGVPTTIKDIVLCHGLDVRYGSRATSDVSDHPDAPSVRRLRAAGAVILGLTNTPEFGWKAVTDSPRNRVTRNPWDPSRTPGGSSGGAAVAAATGAGVLHLGTDGGGSIRIPAAFTGVVGHKPSYGRVPIHPASAFGSVAHIGPIARCVEDVAFLLNAMAGRDLRDWTQAAVEVGPLAPKPIAWSGRRLGYWKAPCIGGVDPEIAAAIERSLEDLELAGAELVEVELPERDGLSEIFRRHWYVGAANRLAAIEPSLHDELDPGFLEIAERGRRYSAVDHLQAEVERAEFGAKMDALLEDLDFIVSPTVPIAPFEAGVNVPVGSRLGSWTEWSSYSFPINLSQQPACSVPCGFTARGLPIGLQIVGGRNEDEAVLSAALTYQQMYPERFLCPAGRWPEQAIGTA